MMDWLGRLFGHKAASAIPRRSAYPPLASLDDLNALIDRCDLRPARELILSRATPCLHIIAGGPAPDAPLGATRLGGAPDLPAGAVWPASEHGACSFLGQFDLADLRAGGGANDLPSAGLLSVFVDVIDSAADPVPVRAILTSPGAALVRLIPPTRHEVYGAYTGWLNPAAVAALIPGIDVPVSDPRLADRIAALAPDGDLDTLQEGVWQTPGGAVGQLFGHGADHDGTDLRRAIHARGIGRPGLERYDFIADWAEWEQLKTISHRLPGGRLHTPWSAAGDDDVRFMLAHRDAIDAEVDQLRLLLSLQSNKATNLWINDTDPIFVFAPAARLRRGDVSELYGAVTQG